MAAFGLRSFRVRISSSKAFPYDCLWRWTSSEACESFVAVNKDYERHTIARPLTSQEVSDDISVEGEGGVLGNCVQFCRMRCW
jgi:hypothetical protein